MSLDLSIVNEVIIKNSITILSSELGPLIQKLSQPELEKLKAVIRELGQKGGLPLSRHRIQVNEAHVVTLLTKYHSPKPPAVRLVSEVLARDADILTKVKGSKSSQTSEEAVGNLKKGLSEKTFNRLCNYVGILVNLPKRPEEVYETLRKDCSVLHKEIPPLIYGMSEATLLDQMIADVNREIELAKLQEVPLLEFHRVYNSGCSPEVIKRAFSSLPAVDKNILLDVINPDRVAALAAFEKDTTELVLHMDALIAPAQHKVDALKAEINAEKQQIFKQWYDQSALNKRQLKALFKMIPGPALAGIPQPPFDGLRVNAELYKTFGAHYDSTSKRTSFAVYAPKAQQVTLLLTAFRRVDHRIELTRDKNGVWKAETDQALPGRSYHFEIVGEKGGVPVKKLDPFGFGMVVHDPEQVDANGFFCAKLGDDDKDKGEFVKAANSADLESVVRDIHEKFAWDDNAWLDTRKSQDIHKLPFNAYELHPLIKRKPNGDLYNWRELGAEMAPYLKNMGYTHVEVLGAFDHPSLAGWGYHVTGYFSPTSRFGSLQDFKAFVNEMHKAGIGVVLDWVPAHFSKAVRGLEHFDGGSLFEDPDPRFEDHATWGSKVFNFADPFVRDFLLSSPMFFFKECHIDGLRVDAVTSALYLTFDRPDNARKNPHGGFINLGAKELFRDVNAVIKRDFPGCFTIAEEYNDYPNLTGDLSVKALDPQMRFSKPKRGIGFDFIWNMPFHNKLFEFVERDYGGRRDRYGEIHLDQTKAWGIVWDVGKRHNASDKTISAYSHDETASGKLSIPRKIFNKDRGVQFLNRISNQEQLREIFANVRLMNALQIAHRGKKLNLMGNEFGQTSEWSWRLLRGLIRRDDPRLVAKGMQNIQHLIAPTTAAVNWNELDSSKKPVRAHFHQGVQKCTRALNHLYLAQQALWDDNPERYSVFHHKDKHNLVLGIHRKGNGKQLAFMFNFSNHSISDYDIPLPYDEEMAKLKGVKELLNTDAADFGGSNMLNSSVAVLRDSDSRPTHMRVKMPALSCIVLEEDLS